jgi:hypothetical protein
VKIRAFFKNAFWHKLWLHYTWFWQYLLQYSLWSHSVTVLEATVLRLWKDEHACCEIRRVWLWVSTTMSDTWRHTEWCVKTFSWRITSFWGASDRLLLYPGENLLSCIVGHSIIRNRLKHENVHRFVWNRFLDISCLSCTVNVKFN